MPEPIRYYPPSTGAAEPRTPRALDGELVRALHNAQKGRCYLCRRGFQPIHVNEKMQATLDHVVPRARGGRDPFNRLLAHKKCNLEKSERLPTVEELRYCQEIYDKIRK